MKTKKLYALSLAAMLALTACSGTPAAPESSGNPDTSDKIYKIGVIQSIEHDALSATHDGFRAALADNGYAEGVDIEYDYQNAQGDTSNLSTIGDRFVSRKVDLILAITTDAAQAVAAKTETIPILATAVTSYTSAGLVESEAAPGRNISGTSDMNPVAAQIDLIKEVVEGVETIGLIYNSSEDNSRLQIDLAKERIEQIGLKYAEVTVTNGSDVIQAMESLVNKCDAIYIPTDNVLANSMASVHSVTMRSKTPTVCGADTMVLEGGLITMGINYYDLGYKTGLMAIELMNGADIATMPIAYADRSDAVTINGTVAREIGFEIPEKYASAVVE